ARAACDRRSTVAMTVTLPSRDTLLTRGSQSSRCPVPGSRYSSTYTSSPETATPVGDQVSEERSTTTRVSGRGGSRVLESQGGCDPIRAAESRAQGRGGQEVIAGPPREVSFHAG